MKKKGLYCQHCNNSVTIYRKGKHKLYVCPNCGTLAYNPVKLKILQGIGEIAKAMPGGNIPTFAKKGIVKAGRYIPGVSDVIGIGEDITGAPLEQGIDLTSGSRSPQREVGRQGFMPRRQGSADQLIRLIQAEKMLGR
ncbi:MAG: hypothetical protein NTU93_00005 [Arthrobacter sp.]|nr:hypothetical protein [Arthrobacter sp.]